MISTDNGKFRFKKLKLSIKEIIFVLLILTFGTFFFLMLWKITKDEKDFEDHIKKEQAH